MKASLNKVIAGRTRAECRADNKDVIKEKKKYYREANKDTIKEKKKKYREANKDKITEYDRKYESGWCCGRCLPGLPPAIGVKPAPVLTPHNTSSESSLLS